MINLHWTQVLAMITAFGIGLLAGVFWHLPFDQVSTLAGLLVGLLIGVIGIAATLWVAASDRSLRLGEIRRDLADVKGAVGTLQATANQMWAPVLSGIVGA